MDPITQQTALATAGTAGAEPLYVDDVFSTFLYEGNGTTQTITNGIDLSGEGGLLWLKSRDSSDNTGGGSPPGFGHGLFDTERGKTSVLKSQRTSGELNYPNAISAFNSNGFSLGDATYNHGNQDFASWTFRKAPGFFDVVTYTGDGVNGRAIPHNLGSVPGCVIIKRRDGTANWFVWHQSAPANTGGHLDGTDAFYSNANIANSAPDASNFYVKNAGFDSNSANGSGSTYVAYFFAHDDQSFGTDSSESIIKCGSITTDSTGHFSDVNLGWEPQWLLFKRTDSAGNWYLIDSMRGIPVGYNDPLLYPDLANAENVNANTVELTPTGFTGGPNSFTGATSNLIYIAIRRPHKPPTDGTEVFAATTDNSQGDGRYSYLGKPVDAWWYYGDRSGGGGFTARQRLTGGGYLKTPTTAAEVSQSTNWWDNNVGTGSGTSTNTNAFSYGWRRAPGFFDAVTYTGTGVARTVSHNLGVVPELYITKCRTITGLWAVQGTVLGNATDNYLQLQAATQMLVDANVAQQPTSTTIGIGTKYPNDAAWNRSGELFVTYLFASLDGISKVGSYTGTGSTLNVDCGFTAGARFVLIKRTDSTGDWYVWDSTRGIVSGNDPYVLINSTAAEVTTTDYIDPLNSGFTVTSSAPAALNASSGTYLFLAIA